jgi:hypothetical protein
MLDAQSIVQMYYTVLPQMEKIQQTKTKKMLYSNKTSSCLLQHTTIAFGTLNVCNGSTSTPENQKTKI